MEESIKVKDKLSIRFEERYQKEIKRLVAQIQELNIQNETLDKPCNS